MKWLRNCTNKSKSVEPEGSLHAANKSLGQLTTGPIIVPSMLFGPTARIFFPLSAKVQLFYRLVSLLAAPACTAQPLQRLFRLQQTFCFVYNKHSVSSTTNIVFSAPIFLVSQKLA
jgi:hypothetical protein